MATESRDVQAAPKVVLPAPRQDSGTALEQQPVPVKILNPSSPPDPSWAIGGALVGALLGAVVAQTIGYKLNRRLRRRDERASSFERALLSGFAARRAVWIHHRADSGEPSWEPFAIALTEFRVAELGYRSRFGERAPGAAELANAVETVARWDLGESTYFDDDDNDERLRDYLEEEARMGGRVVMEMAQREELMEQGQAMQVALEAAAATFGKKHR